ncbi:glutamate--tRNA ligase [Patescibacteria group bacterium]
MIKTRFAPSPTGYLHVGGLRSALYSYLFAKKNNGTFILRIEDTDQERYVEGATENLISTLQWAGVDYEEGPINDKNEKGIFGPYTQSKRSEIYQKYAQELIDNGHAYRCFCTKERLDEMRERQKANNQPTMYDRKCCDLPDSEIKANIDEGKKFVIRQKIPFELIKFKDLVRGNVQFHGKIIDDQVLMKSDGLPTYHLANVVDDHLMEITHVIRGEEWLPSTPKHIALYNAFGWDIPEFAHLPLLLNPDGTKLSKRQGDVAVEDYVKKGYLKEAILNFIAFLGWHPGGGEEREIYTLEELEKLFSIDKVQKSGAIFNLEKLDWYNWRWQKQMHFQKIEKIAKKIDENVEITEPRSGQFRFKFKNEELSEKFTENRGDVLYEICKEHFEFPPEYLKDMNYLYKVLVTIEEKILKNPNETLDNISFYYDLPKYDKDLLTHEKMSVDLRQALESLKESQKELEKVKDWTEENIQNSLLNTVSRLNVKNGQVFWPLRAALSGLQFSPGVFEIAWSLGKKESLNRIEIAIKKFES